MQEQGHPGQRFQFGEKGRDPLPWVSPSAEHTSDHFFSFPQDPEGNCALRENLQAALVGWDILSRRDSSRFERRIRPLLVNPFCEATGFGNGVDASGKLGQA